MRLRKDKRADRIKAGQERQAAYNELSTAEKIAKLDAGGHRAVRQRAKLREKFLVEQNQKKK